MRSVDHVVPATQASSPSSAIASLSSWLCPPRNELPSTVHLPASSTAKYASLQSARPAHQSPRLRSSGWKASTTGKPERSAEEVGPVRYARPCPSRAMPPPCSYPPPPKYVEDNSLEPSAESSSAKAP